MHCLGLSSLSCQEAKVRIQDGTTDWFKVGKGVCQGFILSPGLFNLYAKYIIQNAGRDESQAEIKSAGRNVNRLSYADDISLMAESEEELKNLLMRVREEREKAGLKFNFTKTKIMTSGPITSWQIDGGKSGSSDRLYFCGLQNHCVW